jgi:hypothetical protein
LVKIVIFCIALVRHGSSHGGSGGRPFSDAVDLKLKPMTSCIGVEVIWNRDTLFVIRFIYEEEDNMSIGKVYHGGDSGLSNLIHTYSLLNETFMMNNTWERIDQVTWYVGTTGWVTGDKFVRFVLGIQFRTNARRTSPLYGSSEGDMYTESYEGFTLGYAMGKSGLLVDSLEFVWYNQGK